MAEVRIHFPEFIRVLESLCWLGYINKPVDESSQTILRIAQRFINGEKLKELCNPIVEEVPWDVVCEMRLPVARTSASLEEGAETMERLFLYDSNLDF
jgi:hypothetical protein